MEPILSKVQESGWLEHLQETGRIEEKFKELWKDKISDRSRASENCEPERISYICL